MRRTVAIAAVSGTLLAGATAGVLVGNPVISGAQSAAPSAPAGAKGHQRLNDVLAPLVTDGTLTQTQADAVIKALDAARPDGRGRRGGAMMRAGIETAATALGLSPDELLAQVKAGQTLGQIADAKGVSRTDLVAALVGEARTRVAEAVTNGRMTQQQADALIAGLEARLPGMLDRHLPGPGDRRGPGMCHGGPGGFGMRPGGPGAAGSGSTGA